MGGCFAKGLTVEVLKAHLPDQKKEILEGTTLIVPCLNEHYEIAAKRHQ